MINLSSFIAFHARRTPDRCALKYRGEDVSCAEFDGRIGRVAGWLAARGIGANDVVAVLMMNSTAFLELVFATSHIGAVFLPINYRLSHDEVSYIVGNSGARILIADEELAGIAAGGGGDTFIEAGREIEKIGSTGRAIAHIEIEIRDDSGHRLAAGENGEICLRGPKVTQGYWKDPEKTAAAFFGDWFRSGDVGYLDQDGFLYLTDRKKDLIISGGENIASSEVERVIYELPQVREVAVIGMPDERWGEKPVAIVVLGEGTVLGLTDLTDHCRTRLAGFKVPKQLIIRDSLPRNPSGKVLKRVLRAELGAHP